MGTKIRQLIITVELLENDIEDFPTPTLPKVLLKGKRVYVDENVKLTMEAAKFLGNKLGMSFEESEE